jgi:hypothetical protein
VYFDPAKALPVIRQRLEEFGVTYAAGNLVNASALGVTRIVWRNGPIENAHAGRRGERNGLHDGVMFARNTWVYHQALAALTSKDPYALYAFEDSLLDRDLIWPGTHGTLTQFGYGALGEIRRHAKHKIDYLMDLREENPRDEDYLLLIAAGAMGAEEQFGMPAWQPRVEAAMRRLRGEDPAFIEHLRTRYNREFQVWIDAGPPVLRENLDEVERGLLNAPYELGADALEWFAWNPILDIR